jgi:hypothetical protein
MKQNLLNQIKTTKSTFFILPMLGRSMEWYGERLINCYIGDINRPEYDNHILLLMKFNGSIQSMQFEEALKEHRRFVTSYDPVSGYTVFVYSMPEECLEDYQKFIDGKFSKLSDPYKQLVKGKRSNDHKVVKALYPTEKDRDLLKQQLERIMEMAVVLPEDAEILSIPNLEQEKLNAFLLPVIVKNGLFSDTSKNNFTD